MASSVQKQKKFVDPKDLLMTSLSRFYNVKSNMQKVLPIIEGQSRISLRLIDWFVTNYAKKNNIVITKQISNNIIHFNVYLSYRSQLKAYSKQLFDPFRRRERLTFMYDGKNNIETTIGQLNFFRWVIQNDIIEYLTKNIKEVEDDMIATQKDNHNKKQNEENIKIKTIQTENGIVITKRKKRNQLSKASINNINLMQGPHIIAFD
jgi:hypothetical protein